jgi:RNA polymerase sigma factor (sigma-70 family)
MTKSKSVPVIPANWSRYIKRSARRYACGHFSPEDAEQTAFEAFIRARARYVPAKGPFQHYATSAIRNALLNARIAEQRFREIPADPNDGGGEEVQTPAWAAEGEALRALDEAERGRAVSNWTDSLPAKYASLYQGLYCRNMSQRAFAARTGVSQAAVSQRNKRLLRLAETALAAPATE